MTERVHTPRAWTWLTHALAWVNAHMLLLAVGFLILAVIVWGVAAGGRHLVARNRKTTLGKTAASRNLAARVGPKIGWKDKAEKFVTWPRNPHATGAPITIRYPPQFTALDSQIGFIPEVIRSLVGGEWDPAHDHAHHRLRYIRRAPVGELPAAVEYQDDRRAPADLIPFAKDSDGEWIHADLTGLTPHVLVSATTGYGKTSIISVLVAHAASRGALVDICDPKQIGFTEAFDGLPMVRITTEIDAMIGAVEQFRSDMEARYRDIKAARGRPEPIPLRVLVIDELGSFADMCIDHYQATGKKGTPPVFRSMKRILWQGRAAGFHVISATQQANIKATFGVSDARDQYALRIAAGPQSAEAWRMLFGNEPRPTINGKVKGRAIVGIGAEFTVAQLAHLDPSEARRIAARGHGEHTRPVCNAAGIAPALEVAPAVDVDLDGFPAYENPGPVLQLVKDSAGAAATAPRRGRPPATDRPGRVVECGRCANVWPTRAAPRSTVRCPACGAPRKVPAGVR